MSVTLLTAEPTLDASVTRYPRIGGGSRLKDFGYVGQNIAINGRGQGPRDYNKVLEYGKTRQERVFQVPWGSGETQRMKVLVRRVRFRPQGASCFLFSLECEVVE